MIADTNAIDTVAIDVVSNRRFFPNLQVPRCPNLNSIVNPGVAPNACSKGPQQKSTPAVTQPWRRTKQKEPHKRPDNPPQFVSEAVRTGAMLLINLNLTQCLIIPLGWGCEPSVALPVTSS